MPPVARKMASVAVLLVVSSLAAPPALASFRTPDAVTLDASATTVVGGEQVKLTVTIEPASAAEQVSILDASGSVVAQGATAEDGTFAAAFAPSQSVVLRAVWGALESAPVEIRVVADLSLSVDAGPVRLFDDLRVRGRVRPAMPGADVKVLLERAGRVVATKNARVGDAGTYFTSFRIARPGRYRVKAVLASAADASAVQRTELPQLAEGARGRFVELLERRLVELHYHLTGVDETFDHRTADAVMAFRKVQRMPRVTLVTPGVWGALAEPRRFVPRSRAGGLHVEIDQTRQVLAVVVDGEVDAIAHVSTGKASTPTRDGAFRVFSKLAGFSPKSLYYPSFFDGGRAIHGWTEVPPYPASHGCVRVSYWVATWIFGLAPVGTAVVVYH
jgi:cell wall hydrolase